MTPIVTPPTAMTVISDRSRDDRRLRRYRIATRRSSRDGQFVTRTNSAAPVATTSRIFSATMAIGITQA